MVGGLGCTASAPMSSLKHPRRRASGLTEHSSFRPSARSPPLASPVLPAKLPSPSPRTPPDRPAPVSRKRSLHADDQPTDPQAPTPPQDQVQGPRPRRLPAEARRVPDRPHHY